MPRSKRGKGYRYRELQVSTAEFCSGTARSCSSSESWRPSTISSNLSASSCCLAEDDDDYVVIIQQPPLVEQSNLARNLEEHVPEVDDDESTDDKVREPSSVDTYCPSYLLSGKVCHSKHTVFSHVP
jgi:hypothetical protein